MNAPLRPTWDETWLITAQTIAQRSLCSRAKVGAVITDTTNQYVVTGYNGPPAGYKHGTQPCNIWCKRNSETRPAPDYSDCYTIHAEANALLKSDYTARKGGTIYITSHVCWGCAKLIANSGLSRVVVGTKDDHSHRNPLASYLFLVECGLDVQLPGNDGLMFQIMANRTYEAGTLWCASPLQDEEEEENI